MTIVTAKPPPRVTVPKKSPLRPKYRVVAVNTRSMTQVNTAFELELHLNSFPGKVSQVLPFKAKMPAESGFLIIGIVED